MEPALRDSERLATFGEHFASGYMECSDASLFERWSRAVRRRFEHRPVHEYRGGRLYPSGSRSVASEPSQNRILGPSYSFTWSFNRAALEEASSAAADSGDRGVLARLGEELATLERELSVGSTPHTIGGWGYTHSIPNFGRVLTEGLHGHEARIEAGLAEARGADDNKRAGFYGGLLDVVAGVRAWHSRLVATVKDWPWDSALERANRDELLAALERVPFEPARSFYEAIVAYNFVYYLDDCDNPGRMDQVLQPFYERDLESGRITYEEAQSLIALFADNVCANGGWSAAIGGTTSEGEAGYNDVTRMLLEASHGRYRPSLELRVRRDMPDWVWDSALDAASSGAGNPAFYNEHAYLESLMELDLGLTDEDATWWNGGGCTETMVHGCSNVGSIEAGLNLALVFEGYVHKQLVGAESFEAFLSGFRDRTAQTIAELVDLVNRRLEVKSRLRPHPMRSLLIDDCIERGVDYNAGGARYNWSVVNIAGLSNVVDSLSALREVIFDKCEVAPGEFLEMLSSDFEGDEVLRRRLGQCSRFGNDDPTVDEIASTLGHFVFSEFLRHTPWRGTAFLPSCIMFVTYARVGAGIGAMPDGRHAGAPLADSIGPVQGRDTHGPTALLRSVARLPLTLAAGTPVLNVRFAKALFGSASGRARVRELIESFFELGGMQIQVTVVDRDELIDAQKHPEKHGDLIVRIGGYSAHFTGLDRALQDAVIARTEYGG